MIDYRYKAKDTVTGREIEGFISADNEIAAGKLLIKQNLYPVEIKPKVGSVLGTGSTSGRVPIKAKVIFTRQMATLIKAGLPVGTALNSALGQVDNKKLQNIIFRIGKSVEGGTAFSQALAEYPDCFNHIYVAMVQAGEASGTLDVSMLRLADQIEKEADIISKIRGALVYPALVMLVIIGVLVYMLSSVVPQIVTLYKSFNKALPFVTQVIIWTTDAFGKYWLIIIPAIAAVIYGIYIYIKSPNGRKNMDRLKITLPPFNQLLIKMYMARFARTLGSLTSSGIPILEALKLVGDSLNNTVLETEVRVLAEQVKSGRALSESLAKTEYFLPLVGQMVKVGEDSGTMGDMLDKLATFYENEVDQLVKNLSTLIEPIIIIFLGFMVMIIIIGILFPVYNLVGTGIT